MGRTLDNGTTTAGTGGSASGSSLVLHDGVARDIFGTGQYAIYMSDGAFTVPQNVSRIRVRAIAPGGGGAVKNENGARCTGGAGGGFAMGAYDVSPGDTFQITIGQPGQYVSDGVASAGGTTSFGTLLSATGGGAGNYAQSGTFCQGAEGGQGTGGNIINAKGGNSGSISSGSGSCATGGGGAGSQHGDGGDSGSLLSMLGYVAATGGGAIRGFSSASVTNTSTSTGGAGTASGSIGKLGGYSSFADASDGHGADNPAQYVSRFPSEFLLGGGGAVTTSTVSSFSGGPGAGGGASQSTGGNRAGDGGWLGGGGGAVLSNSGSGGNGGLGGGGGGGAGINGYAGAGSKGGSSIIIVEW
ncbi:hypothetical protein BDK62_10454 [Halomonas alkaliantarctica]|nr:hypothetical protein BDK62_10454 [Halomonas alkaliantarctica]